MVPRGGDSLTNPETPYRTIGEDRGRDGLRGLEVGESGWRGRVLLQTHGILSQPCSVFVHEETEAQGGKQIPPGPQGST